MAILEEAARLIADRLDLYDVVRADMYYMAALDGDTEIQREIWEEAWKNGENHLLSLLLLVEISKW